MTKNIIKTKQICKVCQSVFFRKFKQTYCSKSCAVKDHEWTPERRKKVGDALRRKPINLICNFCKKDYQILHTDPRRRYCCLDCARKGNKGKNHWQWKGGISPLAMKIRTHYKNQLWKKKCLKRDKNSCQKCGSKEKLEVDHSPVPFSIILRTNRIKTLKQGLDCKQLWNTNNGITLCQKCHSETATWGHNADRIFAPLFMSDEDLSYLDLYGITKTKMDKLN